MKKTLKLGLLASVLGIMIGAAGPAGAVTFNLSTLSYNSTTGAKDPVSGMTIFNKSINQINPWTEGTGSGTAAINFALNTQGNNSSKVYLKSGGPGFDLPGTNGVPALSGTETSVGTGNSQYTGAFAMSNGMPFYFALVAPGQTGFTPTLQASTLNSLYIYGASTNLEIFGLNGAANAGGNVIYSQQVQANSGFQQVTLNWTGVEEVYITSAAAGSAFNGYAAASGFYVNDIEVNDPVPNAPVPEPGTMVLLGAGMLGLAVYGKRRTNKNEA